MTNLQKTNSPILNRAENLILYLILGVTPFLFCNQMTYNFHTPKYLFMQVAVFSAVMMILLKSEIRVCINLLDSLVLFRLLWLLPLVFFTARYANLFENVDILTYLVIFYFIIQLVSRVAKKCTKSGREKCTTFSVPQTDSSGLSSFPKVSFSR